MITRMHHFGMMTEDLEESIAAYENLGFELYKRFEKPGMKAAMLFKDSAGIEFFEFENPDDEVEKMIRKHSAFVSDDLDNDVKEFVENGHKLAIAVTEGVIVKRYAYVRDPAGNYIELLEPADDMPA